MNDVRYRWILYTIVFVILSTIGIQVYWNYKNYLNSKQQLINEVQISLDKAVDDYYAHLAEKNTMAFAINSSEPFKLISNSKGHDSIIESLRSKHKLDSLSLTQIRGVPILGSKPKIDSIIEFDYKINDPNTDKKAFDVITHIKSDSLNTAKFRTLTSKVLISLTNDSLSLKRIDSLLKNELLRKKIVIDYSLNFKHLNDSITTYSDYHVLSRSNYEKHLLRTNSESAFLPRGSSLSINFTNVTQIILKRIFGGILISLLLVLAIISSLFYLLYIIKQQKQLAEVKNDLISNITHEFKTPIATIGVAIESIKDFNILEDKEKTKKYLELSSGQLVKLNLMVEKLLETATLDSNNVELDKASADIVDVLRTIVDKHQLQTENKTITFSCDIESLMANVDIFHFENAINNVLDNALKYGGDQIIVAVRQNSVAFSVSISDNGNSITKANKEKIFEKFYRIPQGNTHDVKGFGIGLYYTKKIVEKHGGHIVLDLDKNGTTFKLSFPNA